MRKMIGFLVGVLINISLYGCGIGGFWMNGNPFSSETKLYGEHWVKEGMTQESRLDDTVACGSARTERLGFSAEKKRLERRPEEPDDAKAVGRLTERWVQCMKSKGYHYEP
ncbi:hypothetical protein [Corticimicrobacter populi]|uniref:hypothetical protein n=1 Tax=Corticimicrobacter populi TaxID=2175229 RepID=UPI0011B27408|nr:hypothetical protein [Corticimicrobacter populi]